MKYLATVALCALIFGVAFAGAKVATVTNPMTTDLNGGGNLIYNVSGLSASGDETSLGANFVATHDYIVSVDPGPLVGATVSVTAGSADPSATPDTHPAGSVYLRRIDSTHAELWFNTGNGWTRLTP